MGTVTKGFAFSRVEFLLTPLVCIILGIWFFFFFKANILAKLSGETLDPGFLFFSWFVVPQPVIWGPVVGIFREKKINNCTEYIKKKNKKLEYLISDIMQKRQHQSHLWPRTGLCWGKGGGVLITKVKINMLCLIASGNRLKANLKGYMSQLCMLALCFLSKEVWKTSALTSGHQKMIPPNTSDSTSFWRRERACYKAKMWWVDWVFPTSQGGSHTLREEEEKVNTSLCNKTKQMETPEENKAVKNILRLTNTHCWISFCHSVSFSDRMEVNTFWCRRLFPWCELPLASALLLLQMTSLGAEQRCMLLPSSYHLNIWAFKK